MKKIIALFSVVAMVSALFGCGDAAQTSFTSETTEGIVWEYAADSKEGKEMFFSFDLDVEYTHVIITVNNGMLVSSSDTIGEAAKELRLSLNEGFSWVPSEGSQETAVIVVQVCNMSHTVHCGTISLVPKKTQIQVPGEDIFTVTYTAVLDSDDGLQVRQGDGKSNVVIFA